MAQDPALEGDELGSGYGMTAGRHLRWSAISPIDGRGSASPKVVHYTTHNTISPLNHRFDRNSRCEVMVVRNATYGVVLSTLREYYHRQEGGHTSCRVGVEQRSNWGGNEPGEERVSGWVAKDGEWVVEGAENKTATRKGQDGARPVTLAWQCEDLL
ncbi:hypothetical protein B0H14DRAFT_2558039 [Mycena olivaceomarginata]|nr:hypothetical protein B0H14DRAFT_2558039 [Mycena olivaceomarginata]